LAPGSPIEVSIDLEGKLVRAQGTVRYCTTGKGVGVQFVHMAPNHQARLDQFLSKYSAEPSKRHEHADPAAAQSVAAQSVAPPPAVPPPSEQTDGLKFEAELTQILTVVKQGTYYQLLGATSDMSSTEIKKKFYALARKFHPDHHKEREASLTSLKELMDALNTAYQTLIDQHKRALYDKQLESSGSFGLRSGKTESQKATEDSLNRAKQCIRAGNFVGSIVWLRKCVEMVPEKAEYQAMLARSLGKVPQFRQDAISHFQKAIELDPWNLEPYLGLAELYEEMELTSRALSTYSKVLELNPVHEKARLRHSELSRASVSSR
jgi:tetratricopeptide (TPR) repeat protein